MTPAYLYIDTLKYSLQDMYKIVVTSTSLRGSRVSELGRREELGGGRSVTIQHFRVATATLDC